ncbi:alpha/beta hydrolase [Pueribacillus theae]|uniref:Alpha/beta hydrolase n=1 Tax=Pueribacillus theae TaxID=2171751 RepID=A0A2U1K0G0_9BACI|nr:alpha/beta hydrolase [Pueribacillus theae]PWA10674.1 alpha/beta hydrolase [Pueribacillus theae]
MVQGIIHAMIAAIFLISPTFPNTNGQNDEIETFKPVSSEETDQTYFVDMMQMHSLKHLKGFEDSEIFRGIENGAGYWIEVPKKWNGKLVLYAHGYRGTSSKLTITEPPFRKELLQEGYAWAASSYSTNRYDVETGIKDTHALNRLFRNHVGIPRRTYIMGHSMGGHIAGVYAEQYVNVDGAVPMCGVMGDIELFNFFTAHGLAAQALAGIRKENQQFPADGEYDKVVLPKLREKLGNGVTKEPYTGATVFKELTTAGAKLSVVTENLSGGKRPLFDLAYRHRFNDLLLQQFPKNPYFEVAPGNIIDTTNMIYQLDYNPEMSKEEQTFNDSVLRVSHNPLAKNRSGFSKIPKVTGNLRVPTVTLHTLGDLYVPFSMEQIYKKRAIKHGKSNLLVSRAIRGVGHCKFTSQEEIQALLDLDKWVEEGKVPEGDEILDPDVVADKRYGLKFTSKLRDYDPLK